MYCDGVGGVNVASPVLDCGRCPRGGSLLAFSMVSVTTEQRGSEPGATGFGETAPDGPDSGGPALGGEASGGTERRGRKRVGLWLLVLIALALVGGGLQQAVRRALAVETFPTGSAEWIWEEGRHRQTGPWVLWAIRDFELAKVPASVRLLALADEAYLVHVNGRRIGSNVYHEGMAPDGYEVAPWLRSGANRIAVELRSGRGAGGLLLALVDGTTGAHLLGTDDDWTVFNRHHAGILEGWLPISEGEPAFSWGLPPVGRWGTPSRVVDRPVFSRVAGELWESRPVAPRRFAAGPRVLEILTSGDAGGEDDRSRRLPWRAAGALDGELPADRKGPPVILFDWGREVTGYLTLEHRRGGGRPPGLLQVDDELPEVEPSRAVARVLTVTGGDVWRDELPRHFRYALVLGASSVVAARVAPVAPELRDRLPVPVAESGLLGLPSPRSGTPVENEVRRRLQGLAGGGRGEDL